MLASRAFSFAVLFGLLALTPPSAGQEPLSVHSYVKLPLVFEPNQGQTHPEAKFLSRGNGYMLFLTHGGMLITLPQSGGVGTSSLQRVAIDFVGANKNAALAGVGPLPGRSNYFRGANPSKWRRNIPHFSAVEYRGLYRGIDVRFYGNGNYFEHDFMVAPGADPSQIRLRVRGEGKPILTHDGHLDLAVGTSQLRIKRPHIYQSDGMEKRTIAGNYVVRGQEVTIKLARYDKRLPLIIDPVLVYSTYIAGSKGEFGNGLAVDAAGNAYITGSTISTDFPTQNPLQASCNNCDTPSQLPDIFVSKLNTAGTNLVYSTFLGGSGSDEAASIAVDSSGNAIIVGRTRSSDFPLASAFRSSGVGDEAFVASLNPDGSALNFSTYLGGNNQDFATAVAVDNSGSAYVTGITRSLDFPVTPGTRPSPTPSFPNFDVFVAKLGAAGALQFGLVIHGEAPETVAFRHIFMVNGIAVDSSGNSYITGRASSGWPTTSGAFQPALASTPGTQGTNVFIAKLKPDASDFVYSTYLGGSDADWGKAIAVDGSGNAYVTGDTGSPNFPVTPNAFQASTASCCPAFVTQLNSTGSALVYSSFLSGTEPNFPLNEMIAFGITVDAAGNAYAIGRTKSRTFPIVNPIQALPPAEHVPNAGGISTYVSKFNPAGSALLFSTYFGGSTGTEGRAIAVNPAGTAVYIAGTSFDFDLPTTANAFQREVVGTQFGNPGHPFVAKFDLSSPAPGACFAPRLLSFSPQPLGTTSSAKVTTLTNCGSADLHLSSLGTTADFAASSSCGAPLPPGTSCPLSVTFTPTIAGPIVGALEVNNDAPVSPQAIRLEGRGAVPGIALNFTADFLSFPPQLLNTTSRPVFFGFGNNGDATLNIIDIVMSGDFAQTNNCNRVMVPGTPQCQFTLTFIPTSTGLRTGAITIFHNAANSPLLIPLFGTGFAQAPLPTLSLINPTSGVLGSPAATVVILGQDFFPHSVVRLDGVPVPTTYVGSGQLTASFPASAFTQIGEKSVTVFTPGPGGGESLPLFLTVYRTVNLPASDLVFDPFSQMLFAAIPNTDTTLKNSVVKIDPNTGQILQVAAAGNDPVHLAFSDDGQFLYVALRGENAIRRLQLPNLTFDIQIALGPASNPGSGLLQAADIQVIPGSPHSVVVAKAKPGSFSSDGVVVYDNATKRPDELTGAPFNSEIRSEGLAVTSDGSLVFLASGGSPTFYKMTLSSSGVSLLESSDLVRPTTGLALDGNTLYANGGKIVNAATSEVFGQYIFPEFTTNVMPSLVADVLAQRTFFLAPGNQSAGILAYDAATLGLVGRAGFDSLSSEIKRLVRWGTNGFAFLLPSFSPELSKIVILRSRLAAGGIGMGASASKLSLARGNTSLPITLKLSAPAPAGAAIDLSCAGLPFGATCNFAPSSTINVAAASPATVALTIHVPATAPFGRFLVSVIGRSPAGVASQIIDMSVNDYDLVLSTSEGTAFVGQPVTFHGHLVDTLYTDNANLSCTASLTPPPSSCVVVPVVGKPQNETPFVVTATPALAQDYFFNITATGTDANATMRSKPAVLRAFDMAFGTFSQTTASTVPGSFSPPTTFSVDPLGPFFGSVTLECMGLPVGASCAFNGFPAPTTVFVAQASAPVVLVITVNSGVAAGSYPLTIRATTPGRPAGPLETPFQLTVASAGGSTDLAVNLSMPSAAKHVGEAVTFTATVSNSSTSVVNATLMIAFPDPQRITSATIEGGVSCTGTGAASLLLTCPLGALANGSTTDVTVTVVPRFVVALRAGVEVISEFSDTNLSDNASVFRQPVAPRPLVRQGLPPRLR